MKTRAEHRDDLEAENAGQDIVRNPNWKPVTLTEAQKSIWLDELAAERFNKQEAAAVIAADQIERDEFKVIYDYLDGGGDLDRPQMRKVIKKLIRAVITQQ